MQSLNRFLIFISIMLAVACTGKVERSRTPWGTNVSSEGETAGDSLFSLNDIIDNGEMIMLTLSGPEYYYDYLGHGFGTQYLLCEKFAKTIGVSVRVDICKDTMEMVRRLTRSEADIIAFPLPKDIEGKEHLLFCGAGDDSHQWAVGENAKELADAISRWYKPEMVAQVKDYEDYVFSERSIQRHVYAPVLNETRGLISNYDHLFRKYAPVARVDWRLLAALAYQESCFDPHAKSWAGACGLMQIMPSTASHLGLSMANIYDPEANVAASARYISELQRLFADVPEHERMNFVLACYNGGNGHVRDAMELTRKYGGNAYSWNDVSQFVLRLSEPRFYQDPVVKYGYMRGTETFNYVSLVQQRYMKYSGIAGGASFSSGPYTSPDPSTGVSPTPQRATKNHRFRL